MVTTKLMRVPRKIRSGAFSCVTGGLHLFDLGCGMTKVCNTCGVRKDITEYYCHGKGTGSPGFLPVFKSVAAAKRAGWKRSDLSEVTLTLKGAEG